MSLFEQLQARYAEENLSEQEIVARGAGAERLLRDEVFATALEEIEAGAVIEWAESKDPENRDGLWVILKGLEALRGKLREYVAAKDMAEEREKERERR